jgi:hypothetical protein
MASGDTPAARTIVLGHYTAGRVRHRLSATRPLTQTGHAKGVWALCDSVLVKRRPTETEVVQQFSPGDELADVEGIARLYLDEKGGR